MLKQRLLTAFILVPVVLLTTYFSSTATFAVLLTVFILLGAWEWAAMSGYRGLIAKLCYVLLLAGLLITCFLSRFTVLPVVVVILAVCWWVAAAILVTVQQQRQRLPSIHRNGKAVMGILVLVPAWFCLVLLHAGPRYGAEYAVYLLVLIALADSAAYFAGHHWGKHRLAAIISPGKTWEGVLGAAAAAVVAGLLFALATGMQVPDIIMFSLLSLLTVTGSVVGDLVESLIKRLGGVKDSGAIFPGHGGVMDRIDSLTAAAPVFLAGLWLTEVVKS